MASALAIAHKMLREATRYAGYFLMGAVGVQLVKLFLLPNAHMRRKRLAYLIANFGAANKALPSIPPVSHLSKLVIRVMGLNPGPFTLQGSNTYLVGSGDKRILIDSGDGRQEYLALLEKVLKDEGCVISHVIITHEHYDHIGGIPLLRSLCPGVKVLKFCKSSLERDPAGLPYDGDLQNGTTVAADGCTLRAVLTPGHCKDHVALVLEEEGTVFSGDCVLGSGTAVFEDLHQYVGSLRILQGELEAIKANGGAAKIYPGHGLLVDDGVAKIKEYIAHRQAREDQILALLDSSKLITCDALVDTIYQDQNLNWVVRRGAVRSTMQALLKLQKEGKVFQANSTQWSKRREHQD